MKLFFIIALSFGLVYGRLPVGIFPKCARSDTDITKCILQGVEAVRPLLMDGIPEVSFPSLEPFTMSQIPLDTSIPGLKLRGEATNIVARGAGDFRIRNLNINYGKKTADLTIVIPKLEVTADYSLKGSKVIFFNIDGTGKFTGTFNEVKAVISALGKLDNDDGLDFIRMPYVNVKIDIGKGSVIHVEPNNSRFASRWAAKMINMAPTKLILKMLQSSINKTAGQILKKYINRVLDETPLQDVLEY